MSRRKLRRINPEAFDFMTIGLTLAERGLLSLMATTEIVEGQALELSEYLAEGLAISPDDLLDLAFSLERMGLAQILRPSPEGGGPRLAVRDLNRMTRDGKTPRSPIPAAVREEVWQRDGERCHYCGTTHGPFALDHVFPWSRGGQHWPINLVVACQACNASKGDLTPEEWRARP